MRYLYPTPPASTLPPSAESKFDRQLGRRRPNLTVDWDSVTQSPSPSRMRCRHHHISSQVSRRVAARGAVERESACLATAPDRRRRACPNALPPPHRPSHGQPHRRRRRRSRTTNRTNASAAATATPSNAPRCRLRRRHTTDRACDRGRGRRARARADQHDCEKRVVFCVAQRGTSRSATSSGRSATPSSSGARPRRRRIRRPAAPPGPTTEPVARRAAPLAGGAAPRSRRPPTTARARARSPFRPDARDVSSVSGGPSGGAARRPRGERRPAARALGARRGGWSTAARLSRAPCAVR